MLKKIMAIILSGLLIFGFTGLVAEAAPLDIVFDFETDADVDTTIPEGETTTVSGWKAGSKGGTIKRNTEDIEPALTELGSSCLELVAKTETETGGVGRGVMYRLTGLKPKGTYEISGYVKGTSTFAFGLAGNITDSTSYWPGYISKTLTGKWEKLSKIVTLNQADSWSGVTQLALRNDTNEKVLFDHIRIRELTDYVAPTEAVTARSINGDFEDITTRDTSSTNTTQVLAPSNWTVGSSLKNGTDTDAYAVVTSEKARSGNYSLKIRSNKNNAGYRVYRQVTNLEVGALYMLSFWTCVEQNVVYTYAAGANVYATRSWDHDGSEGSALNAQAFEKMKTKTDGEWVLSRSYFVPGGSTICLSIVCGDNNPFTAYFDDITLEKVSSIDLKAVDSAGKKITKLDTTKENKVKVYLSGANKDNVISSHKVIYAIYNKNGEITEVSALSLKDIVNTAATISTTGQSTSVGYLRDKLEFTIPAGSTAKVFAFSDLSTLIPTTVLELS